MGIMPRLSVAEPKAIAALVLYAVCAGIVVVIGYLGGSLVY